MSSFDALVSDAAALLDACREAGVKLATAESCTGSLVRLPLPPPPGRPTSSSAASSPIPMSPRSSCSACRWLDRAPRRGQRRGRHRHGRRRIGAIACRLAVSVTGIAGPDGGSPAKPVGLVHLGRARRGGAMLHERRVFVGDRAAVREQSVALAFATIRRQLVATA